MAHFENFLEELQNALNHLNDPLFRPAPYLCRLLGITPADPDWSTVLHQTFHRLQPPADTPPTSRNHRLYQILLLRYSQELTQEAAAEQLHITARHLRREQNDAVQALARLLWEYNPTSDTSTDEWSTQLREELTALQRGAPSGTADAGETIQRVVELLAPVLAKSGVSLGVGEVPSGLSLAAQATGVRQLLVRAITEWARHLSDGFIEISADPYGEEAHIRLTGSPAPLQHLAEDPLVLELLGEFGGSIAVQESAEQTTLALRLIPAPPVRVLVVDDNEDLIHFYRRYTANTRYQIIPLTDGALLFDALEEHRPDTIILDVMLPTADGWEMLTHLRQHPLGRTLPILVCSVIQEEDLAYALGASGYIGKPVGRSALLQALDKAMDGAKARLAGPKAGE